MQTVACMNKTEITNGFLRTVFFVSIPFIIGCGPNEAILNSNKETPVSVNAPASVETAASTFEKDLETMRTADFDFIYVFRRTDAAKLDADDRAFLRVNTAEVNRRKLSDEDRAIIVGSNYRIPAENLKALSDRFAVADHSKPESDIKPGNTNANG